MHNADEGKRRDGEEIGDEGSSILESESADQSAPAPADAQLSI